MSSLPLAYALMGVTTVVCLLPFFAALRGRRTDMFAPIFWASAYFLLLFVLRPLYDLTLGSEFLGKAPFARATGEAFNLGLLYALLGLCLFFAGYYSTLGPRLADRFPKLPPNWSDRRVRVAWPLLLGLGSVAYFLLVWSFGGWEYYLCHKQETLTAPGQGYLQLGVSLILVVFALNLSQFLGTGKHGYMVYGLLLPVLLAIGFFSGSKGAFLMPILVAMVVHHYLKGNIRFRSILALVLFSSLLFPVFNTYRHYSCAASTSTPTSISAPGAATDKLTLEILVRHAMSRFYGIDSLAIIIRDTPKVMEFQHGDTVLPLFVAWIPRQIWEDKPTISFGKVFAEKYLGEFFAGTDISASPTLLGEAYLNWHLPGLLLVSLLSGVFIRSAYVWLIQRNLGAPAVFVYSQFFLYFFMFWEASIAGLLAERIASLVILLAVVFLIGRPRGR